MTTSCSYLMLVLYALSIYIFWRNKIIVSKNIDDQVRFFIAYVILTSEVLLILMGKYLGISDEYLPHLIVELLGIAITVLLIDRAYKYINSKNEELYRRLALKSCKMPIYTYCAEWFFIYEHDNNKLRSELDKYNSIEDFFKSNDFHKRIKDFDFNKIFADNQKYAQDYTERMLDIADRFQKILAKYASKLSYKDIQLLEHFGGRAYFFTVFALMGFLCEVKFSQKHGNEPVESISLPLNSFKDIDRENFNKHFDKLIELINSYNGVVDNDYEKWTIKNISQLHTIKSANGNPAVEW